MEVKLGKLISMNYNCAELDFSSPGIYGRRLVKDVSVEGDFDFTTDDIRVDDDAIFIWEITD